ncbi:MAG TPA: bifunctional phosphopantothenoylcysteine decarboxylase/phosphopantothenate--cysteine ligase CoaBC [Candidatus Acidoferrales bacterium]|nr:bifunctional phosphopantothenoylcysteine decarboxylase/phosphopantothenate--cysteine ligase CoaBC [Candidatus Acidoferrales bacterium]
MPRPLESKTIVVGLTGGIACYKAAELVRALVRGGASVRVMMTPAACEFITPLTLQTLSGHPVATALFDLTQESQIGHIQLADCADAIIVAPATANSIGKIAAGLADDIVSTVVLATKAPLLLAPSMNVNMYENPVVQENIDRLRARGIRVIEPGEGFLACGWEGKGRLVETDVLVAEVERAISTNDLRGQRLLITAGPNREAIDPVRFISNRSTGKMGFALAAAAWRRGAEVVLVAGPTTLATPHGVRRIDVVSAAEMHQAVRKEIKAAAVLLMTAAVADYRPAQVAQQKLKKAEGGMTIALTRTVDILGDLAPQKGTRIVVGFAAETEDVVANAQRKLEAKNLDLIVANDVARPDAGFSVDTNAVTMFDRKGVREDVPLMSKTEVADRILDRVVTLCRKPRIRVVGPTRWAGRKVRHPSR